MFRIFHKRRKYPIITDESGRSARSQAFDLFSMKYRPSQVFKDGLVPVSMKTLLRYFEDWKKQEHKIPYAILRKLVRANPESDESSIKMLAEHYEVPPEQIALILQKPWGINRLARGELPDKKPERSRSEIEDRLEGALRLINFGEQLCCNSPEQTQRLLVEIVTLQDNTILTISKLKGEITIRKEKL